MKEKLEQFLSNTEKKIILKDSKEFFLRTGLKPNFEFEDITVLKYLLNQEIYNIEEALALLVQNKLSFCYNQLEKKIPYILLEMEQNGILLSAEKLNSLKREVADQLEYISSQIKTIAGEDFNLNSPKQVNAILFTKLGLKSKKKTSGGELSTSAKVLEELADEGVEIAKKLIDYRHLHKLLNTYILVLLDRIEHSPDSRIRTTFSSTATLTGRLNSKNPNLQNLPAKTEIGAKIKKCFIAHKGFTLISFDYSQIELRILAHLANIDPLKKAFFNNEDIHKSTASFMFEMPMESVTQTLRNNAKAINFGIIYGLSAFALAKTLGVSTSRASEYMKSYFKKYFGIKLYMEETEEIAKKDGFVRTILGKKCYLEGINSSNYLVRSHAIRSAINARIQGSAADLIKLAMLKISEITSENCKLVLQIHDELVFEIKDEYLEEYSSKITKIMESAIRLSVPLIVNSKEFN